MPIRVSLERPVAEQATKSSASLVVEVVTGLVAEPWFLTASRVLIVGVVARNVVEALIAGEALAGESAQCTLRRGRSGCQGPGEDRKDTSEANLSRCDDIAEADWRNKDGSQGLD